MSQDPPWLTASPLESYPKADPPDDPSQPQRFSHLNSLDPLWGQMEACGGHLASRPQSLHSRSPALCPLMETPLTVSLPGSGAGAFRLKCVQTQLGRFRWCRKCCCGEWSLSLSQPSCVRQSRAGWPAGCCRLRPTIPAALGPLCMSSEALHCSLGVSVSPRGGAPPMQLQANPSGPWTPSALCLRPGTGDSPGHSFPE